MNILDRSPLFDNAVRSEAPNVRFEVNGREYNHAYWLADGIYPSYQCFIKTFGKPSTRMQKLFATKQEAKRKDVECAFEILQARFHFLTTPCRLWDRSAMNLVMKACVILHNMIIDFEREHSLDSYWTQANDFRPQNPFEIMVRNEQQTAKDRIRLIRQMKDCAGNDQLQQDLMIHTWDLWTSENIGNDE